MAGGHKPCRSCGCPSLSPHTSMHNLICYCCTMCPLRHPTALLCTHTHTPFYCCTICLCGPSHTLCSLYCIARRGRKWKPEERGGSWRLWLLLQPEGWEGATTGQEPWSYNLTSWLADCQLDSPGLSYRLRYCTDKPDVTTQCEDLALLNSMRFLPLTSVL